jgi:hypothetical protein
MLELLGASFTGRQALETISLQKVAVYVVDTIKYYYRERDKETDPWGPWLPSTNTTGLSFTENGVKTIYIPKDRSNLEATLTLIHEATHAGQPADKPMPESEFEAYGNGARYLVENPSLIPSAPSLYKGFVKEKEGLFCVDEANIKDHVNESPAYSPKAQLFEWKRNSDGRYVAEFGNKVQVIGGDSDGCKSAVTELGHELGAKGLSASPKIVTSVQKPLSPDGPT